MTLGNGEWETGNGNVASLDEGEERILSRRLRGTKSQLCTLPRSEPLCLHASVLKNKMRILCGKILRNVNHGT